MTIKKMSVKKKRKIRKKKVKDPCLTCEDRRSCYIYNKLYKSS